MITRRGLLSGILAAGVSPWIVKAGVLMPVKRIIVPEWGDGFASLLRKPQIEINSQLRERVFDGFIEYEDQFGNYGYLDLSHTIRRVNLNEDWMPLHLT